MREKLIELLTDIVGFLDWDNITDLADYLIENGVKIPVRCKNCRFEPEIGTRTKGMVWCHKFHTEVKPNGYCGYGEPKESEVEE